MRFALLAVLLVVSTGSWSQQPADPHKTANQSAEAAQNQEVPKPKPEQLDPVPIRITEPTVIKVESVEDAASAERQSKDLEAQQAQAFWATVLAGLGGLTAALLLYQNYLLRTQVRGARQEFIAAHRPRLIVRQVSIDGGILQYFIYNVGDSPAKITQICESDWLPGNADNLSALPPYSDSIEVGVTLKSGQWMGRRFRSSNAEELQFRLGAGAIRKHDQPVILVLGLISYEDNLGTMRNTAFLRRYDFSNGRFARIDDPDYEYQD